MMTYEEIKGMQEYAPLVEQIEEMMEDREFSESLMNADSAQEFRSLVMTKGIEMDETTANAAFAVVHGEKTGELNGEELDAVAGGIIVEAIVIGFFAGLVVGGAVGIAYWRYKQSFGDKSCK